MPTVRRMMDPRFFAVLAAFAVAISLAEIHPMVTKFADAVNGGCVSAMLITRGEPTPARARKPDPTPPTA